MGNCSPIVLLIYQWDTIYQWHTTQYCEYRLSKFLAHQSPEHTLEITPQTVSVAEALGPNRFVSLELFHASLKNVCILQSFVMTHGAVVVSVHAPRTYMMHHQVECTEFFALIWDKKNT